MSEETPSEEAQRLLGGATPAPGTEAFLRLQQYQLLVRLLEVLAAAHATAEQQGHSSIPEPEAWALTMAAHGPEVYGVQPHVRRRPTQPGGYYVLAFTLRDCAELATELVERLDVELAVPHPDRPGDHLRP